jgi:hypothetical protein
MKILTVLLILSGFAFNCAAQIDEEKALYIQKAEKYRRMKTTGQVLTFGGTVMSIVGFVMLSNVETTTNSYGQTVTTGNVGGGIALYLLGSCAVGAGVPLWIVGGINQGRYERKLQNSMTVSLNISPQSNGLGIRYRF